MKRPSRDAPPQCLVTGRGCEEHELLRFVVSPTGEVTPDLAGKLQGDVFWVRGEKKYVQQAVADDMFSKAAGRVLLVPPLLADRLDDLLVDQLLGQLGMARRGGVLAAGFAKVEASVRKGEARLVIAAQDAATDGRGKIAALARQKNVPIITELSVTALSSALGLENAVHLAITNNGWARSIAQKASRLARYRHGVLSLDSEDTTSAPPIGLADGETEKDER